MFMSTWSVTHLSRTDGLSLGLISGGLILGSPAKATYGACSLRSILHSLK